MEVILVVVIVGVAAALAAPNMRIGIENRQGKQAAETVRSIFHAIRMYEADRGAPPGSIGDLETAGYLNSAEYAFKRTSSNTDSEGYEYTIDTTGSTRCVWANRFTITTTVIKGACHQENCRDVCSGPSRCQTCDWVCDTVCLPDTVVTTKNPIGDPIQVCE